jgi:adenosylcobyric acid synthase
MNPILLKPKGDMTSQIIFQGKPYGDMKTEEYYRNFALSKGWEGAKASLERLSSQYDLILIEGAGSPAEINIYDVDIANMRIAEAAEAPVVLVADIDRGGVFASLVGTMELLKPAHRELVKGFVINKFRGSLTLLDNGLRQLETLTGKPVLGVVPYIQGILLPGEDSVSLEDETSSIPPNSIKIAVVRLPRISNFTDFDPLKLEPGVTVYYADSPERLGKPDAIILPGTKNTIQDLDWLQETGLAAEIVRRIGEDHTPVIGICGGYQMLGREVVDEKGIEGGIPRKMEGLGLLDITTKFDAYTKTTLQVTAHAIGGSPLLEGAGGESFSGYEIHMGTIHLGKDAKPVFRVVKSGNITTPRLEGAADARGSLVFGTCIHGLFDYSPIRRTLLSYLSTKKKTPPPRFQGSIREIWLRDLEKLAQTLKTNFNMDKLWEIIGLPSP